MEVKRVPNAQEMAGSSPRASSENPYFPLADNPGVGPSMLTTASVEALPKSPAPRSENKRRNAASFLSGGRARVPGRRDLTVWPIMPVAGCLALRVLAEVAEESENRVRAWSAAGARLKSE